jgi:hypothetical protein
MDTPVSVETPGPAPSVAPPSAAEAQAQINAIYADRSHPYHKGDPAATEAMNRLFRLHHGGPGALEQTELRHDLPAEISVPPGLDLPDVVREDVAATIQSAGLSGLAQPLFDFGLGRGGPPTLPPGYRAPSPDVAVAKLREFEGRHAAHVLDKARLGAQALDRFRAGAGRPAGELLRFLDETGAGNDPAVVRLFARLAGRFAHTDPDVMRALAQRKGGSSR